MGRRTLTFDQIEIINKKSAGDLHDNDWLIVNWLVNGVATGDPETLGPFVLDSGMAFRHSL